MTINNRGLFGQPILPYVDFRSYAGADIFIDMSFLDHTGSPVQPTSFVYQIDDMTNAVSMVQQTSVTITGVQQTIQIPGSSLVMTHNWQGSQVCQISMSAILPDTSTVRQVAILELCAIQTPQNTGSVSF